MKAGIAVDTIMRESCLARLRAEEASLRRVGVLHVGLFGSIARGEARDDSDVDVLVELDPVARVDLIDFIRLKNHLTQLLGREVDLVSRRGLRPERHQNILDETVYAF